MPTEENETVATNAGQKHDFSARNAHVETSIWSEAGPEEHATLWRTYLHHIHIATNVRPHSIPLHLLNIASLLDDPDIASPSPTAPYQVGPHDPASAHTASARIAASARLPTSNIILRPLPRHTAWSAHVVCPQSAQHDRTPCPHHSLPDLHHLHPPSEAGPPTGMFSSTPAASPSPPTPPRPWAPPPATPRHQHQTQL